MKSLTQPSDFIDQWGLLDKRYKPDGGDSCQREGMYFSLLAMVPFPGSYFRKPQQSSRTEYHIMMAKLYKGRGVFVRHWNPDWDASDWDRMSRDQFKPQIIAAGYWSLPHLKNIAKGHLRRGFLFTNNVRKNGTNRENHGMVAAGELRDYHWKLPDFTLFDVWALFIRAFRAWYLYPMLLLFDLYFVVNAIKWRWFPQHNIIFNHTLAQLQAIDRMPTPWSWLAEKIMPMDKQIALISDHFDDFPDDMIWFGMMFYEAYQEIKGGRKVTRDMKGKPYEPR